jgi:peptidoglycan/xylan/chitin deacetylase (PgdA/CDA1 family)
MHTPATVFVIGRWAVAYPHLVADEVRAGSEVGDHTENHPPLAELSPAAQIAEITEAAHAIHAAGAPYPVLLRPPSGSLHQSTLEVLRAERMLMVLWSADTSDYLRPGVSKIIYTAVSGAQPGAIILMHDGGGDRSETVAALPRIITRLRQRGFRLVTLSQLRSAILQGPVHVVRTRRSLASFESPVVAALAAFRQPQYPQRTRRLGRLMCGDACLV